MLQTGHQLFGVIGLNAGYHSLTLSPTSGRPIIDYIVYTPSASTSLNKKVLILDDTDTDLKYKGNWSSSSGTRFDSGLPYRDTRRGSTTAGDSISLEFIGERLVVATFARFQRHHKPQGPLSLCSES